MSFLLLLLNICFCFSLLAAFFRTTISPCCIYSYVWISHRLYIPSIMFMMYHLASIGNHIHTSFYAYISQNAANNAFLKLKVERLQEEAAKYKRKSCLALGAI